jgi:hypothetical protein
MLTLEEVITKLFDRNLRKVSDSTGLNHGLVCKIARGESKSVSYDTIKKLSDYFEMNK